VAILTADYGYDVHQLDLTDDEVRRIKSKLDFTKRGKFGVKVMVE